MSPLASYVVETLVTLVAIAVLCVAVLYGARRLGIGRPSGPLELVGRLPLDGRRAVYLVRVEQRVYIVGASEAGLTKLGELGAGEVNLEPEGEAPNFRSTLARLKNARLATRAPSITGDTTLDSAELAPSTVPDTTRDDGVTDTPLPTIPEAPKRPPHEASTLTKTLKVNPGTPDTERGDADSKAEAPDTNKVRA